MEEVEEKGPPQEVDAPTKPKEEDISRIDRDLEKIKLDLAGKAPWWILWLLFIALAVVGTWLLLGGTVFKTATWAGYLVGLGGAAIITYLYKLYK